MITEAPECWDLLSEDAVHSEARCLVEEGRELDISALKGRRKGREAEKNVGEIATSDWENSHLGLVSG